MKQRNGYYQVVFGRQVSIKQIFLAWFYVFSYLFRIPIENITRSDLGERYYNTLLSVTIAIALVIIPIPLCKINVGYFDWERLFLFYGTWYLYSALYIWSSFKRWQEVNNNPSVWDFKRFSLSTGKPHRILLMTKIKGEYVTAKFLSTVLEPGIFLVSGILLTLLLQPIGVIFIVCAVIYSLGYVATYHYADMFMMDKIDQIICNEDLHEIFVDDKASERGFEFYGKRPTDKEAREKLYDNIVDAEIIDDDEPPVVS